MEYFNLGSLLVAGALLVISIILLVLYIKKSQHYKKIHNEYKDIIDINDEVRKRGSELQGLVSKLNNLEDEYVQKNTQLSNEYQAKRKVYDQLAKEISIVEEDLEITEYGVYKPHFDFDTSEEYKNTLNNVRKAQKQLIKEKKAIVCQTEWQVGGSKRKGRKMTNQYMKLMLRAFNGECDAAILKVKWNNVSKMEQRIRKTYDAINKLGTVHSTVIISNYLDLRLAELYLAHEYQEKLHEEREEQRRAREQMREEAKVQKEIEKAKKDAESEEKRYDKAIEQARKELEKAEGAAIGKLNEEIALLQKQLKEAHEKKERALSMAQKTKTGHIYIISNLGSFGKNIYKIGMTRRLIPMDRVKELGDASVPFGFDVHAMIRSNNAPDLEKSLHSIFAKRRLNLINTRKEFFRATLNEIEKVVKKKHGDVEFVKIAEAKEYRETLAVLEERKNKKIMEQKIEAKFPAAL